jgi:outer membrane protein OmpA-like peptidoglycan-associated protein
MRKKKSIKLKRIDRLRGGQLKDSMSPESKPFARTIRLKRVDWIIIAVCFAGTLFCSIAFLAIYNRTLTKLNETPIAEITFKKNTAQRRFIDRGVWDRLKLSSSIYNGDTIRTIVQSEAMVVFEDDIAYLSLDENTMLQIFASERQGKRIDLAEGNIEIDSASPEQTIMVTTEDHTIAVNGQVIIQKSDEGLNLAVIEGNANLNKTNIESGKAVALNERGEVRFIPLTAIPLFGPSALTANLPEINETISVESPPEEKPVAKEKPVLPIIYFISYTAETFEAEENLFTHIALILRENPEYNITIEGHANYTIDPANTAARASEQKYELKPLSEIRAKSIANKLVQLGVASDRITVVGIGGEKPLAEWEDKDNWWQNRRAEFVLD